MTISWPIANLRPGTITRQLLPKTTRGTSSLGGLIQRVSVPAHCWAIEYGNIVVSTSTDRLVWDNFEARLDGGSVPVLVQLSSMDVFGSSNGTASVAASAGDTTLVIERIGADPVLVGYHFSIGERLYRVSAVTSTVGDIFTVNIRPPLRDDVSISATINFLALACKCRLASDDEMKMTFNPARIGIGNVKFLEDPS